MRGFYYGLKAVYRPQKRDVTKLMSKDGDRILQDKAEILDRFAHDSDQRLSIPDSLDRNKLNQIQQQPTITTMSAELVFKELLGAIALMGYQVVKPRVGVEYLLKSGSMETPRFRRSSLTWSCSFENMCGYHKTGKTLALFPYSKKRQ